MTRPLLAFLAAAILLCGAAATAPEPVAGAALKPGQPPRAAAGPLRFDVRIGDGLLQLRIRGCATCATAVTVVIELPPLFRGEARATS